MVAAAIRSAQALLRDGSPLVADDPSRGGWTYITDHGRLTEQAVRDAGAAVAARADQLAADRLATVGQQPQFLAWRPEGFNSDDEWVTFVSDLSGTIRGKAEELQQWWSSLTPTERSDQADAFKALRAEIVERGRPVVEEMARIKQGESSYLMAQAAVRADAYRAALAEQRSLGPVNGMITVHRDSSRDAVGRLQEALGSYPTAWIDTDMQRLTGLGARPLLVRDSKKLTKTAGMFGNKVEYPERAYYHHSTSVKVTGDESEKATRRMSATSRIPKGARVVKEFWGARRGSRVTEITSPNPSAIEAGTVTRWVEVEVSGATVKQMTNVSELVVDWTPSGCTRPGVSTAMHEYGHRAELTNPAINNVAQAFLARRTTTTDGVRDPLSAYHTTRTTGVPTTAAQLRSVTQAARRETPEYTRPDGFANVYVGKQYPQSQSSEVFTTGMEGVFAGRFGGLIGTGGHRADPEHRDLILGILATA